jgi:transketolase
MKQTRMTDKQLQTMALRVRECILGMATGGGCFIGSAFSCADLLVYLYTRFLDVDAERLDDPHRDYFFLSKGHAAPALYATLVEVGLLEAARLDHHLQTEDLIYWHPNRQVPGVEFHTGSLGHGLAVALGVALDCRMRRQANRVVVLTGDGELNEGANWEACLVASAHHLDNLVIVVDRNAFQANYPTEDLIPLEPLEAKFEAFGCEVARVDGHNFGGMAETFEQIPFGEGKPSVVIADTVRGRGIPSIERRADRWFCDFSAPEIEQLREELHGK